MRWVRRLASMVVVVGLLVGVPLVLAVTVGSPVPARWPDGQQLRAWIAEPLTEESIVATVKALVWLLWLAVAATAVIDGVARVWRWSRRLARLPLPTPLQATATGMAGAAVFGTGTGPAVADQPEAGVGVAATGVAAGYEQPLPALLRPVPAGPGRGVSAPGGGWLPGEVADAVAAATTLVWLRRRRDYQPRQPQPGRDDADLVGPSATVAAILAARQPGTDGVDAGAVPDVGDRPAGPVGEVAAPVLAHHLPPGGVGLTGAGAAGAARGLLVTALLAGRPGYQGVVVTTAVDLAMLFGPAVVRLGTIPGLHVGDSIDAALAAVLADGGAPPAGPGTFVTVVTHAPVDADAARRLTIALASVPTLARLAVVGSWPAATWVVDAEGVVSSTGETAVRRLCVLPAPAAADLLVLAGKATSAAGPPVTSPAQDSHDGRGQPVVEVVTERADGYTDRQRGELSLQVLGGLVAARSGAPVPVGRDAARQLLVYLAVHRAGVTARDLTGLLWPGPYSAALTRRLHTTVSDLRRILPTPGPEPVVQRVGEAYRLLPDLEVDLWRLRDAVTEADTALSIADRDRALHRIVASYGGELAAGHTWPWLPALREAVRRDAIDAYTALAATAADPPAALALLHEALRIDPLNEALHRQAIGVLTATGQRPAAVDLLERYLIRLAEAGLTPSDAVQHLAVRLGPPPS